MWLSDKEVKKIKEKYPEGTRIRLQHMNDKYAVPEGSLGTVDFVDDQGQLHMYWDNGKSLALIPNYDEFDIVSKPSQDIEDLRVIIVEPNTFPRVSIIENSLESMQSVVGGYIESIFLDEKTCLIDNSEGKLLGLEPNRRLFSDIIVGTFIIVGADDQGEFVSLTDHQVNIYMDKFQEIESFTIEEAFNSINLKF